MPILAWQVQNYNKSSTWLPRRAEKAQSGPAKDFARDPLAFQ